MINVSLFFFFVSLFVWAINRRKRESPGSPYFEQSLLMQLKLSIKIYLKRTVLDSFTGICINILGGMFTIVFGVLSPKIMILPLFGVSSCLKNLPSFLSSSSKATNALLLLGKVAAYALTLTGFFYCQVTPALVPEFSLKWPSFE